MNVYKVTDGEGVYVFVSAENRRDALRGYPEPEGAAHSYLVERNTDMPAGECTLEYQRSRGVDLILSGVIQPNWYNDLHDASFDDYRDWAPWRRISVQPESSPL